MRNIFLTFFIISFSFISHSQQINDSINCNVDKSYFKNLAIDFPALVISPLYWDKSEWIGAGAVVGASVILYSQDKQIADFWQRNRNDGFDKANEYFFDPLGKMYYTIPLMGAFYIYGSFADNTKSKKVAMDFVKASLYSGILVTAIKHVAHRHRPFQSIPHNPNLWDGPFTENWSHTSFPSGHTIMTFTFAAVIANHYKDKIWIPLTVYSLATLEGVARMYDDKHWSSDVIVGAALGYAIGTFVVNRQHSKILTLPIISSNFTGLSFYYPLD